MKILNRYPVDTPAQVRYANEYFEEYLNDFTVSDRVMFAQGLTEAADIHGVELTEKVAEYTGVPRQDISVGLHMRNYLTGGHKIDAINGLTKIAHSTDPYDMVLLLEEFDKQNNLERHYHRMPDPYQTVFVKVAETVRDETWRGPTDTLSQSKFETWARDPKSKSILQETFTPDLAIELIRNPWEIFMSLPDPHKQMIARMVNDNVLNGLNSPGRSLYDYDGALNSEQLDESPEQQLRRLETRNYSGGPSRMAELMHGKTKSNEAMNRITASVLHEMKSQKTTKQANK
jgi:hypothetical protein